MTHRDLIKLIEHPECLNEDTLPVIARLTEEYPYFQTARLLYIMNLQVVKDAFFPAELKKSAFLVSDRKNLFYRLTGDQFKHLRTKRENEFLLEDTFKLIDSFLIETGDLEDDLQIEHSTTRRKEEDGLPSLPLTTYNIEYSDTETPAIALKHQDIIDQFLEEDEKEPIRISLDEERSFTPPVQEQKEEEEAGSPFFSETLAKIYIKQRKYDKAIEIIQKLSLLYPEKSVYFADQIRFLNKLNINAKK